MTQALGVPAAPRPKGTYAASNPKLSPTQEAHLVALYHAGEHTVSELDELFPVTRSTIYRAMARAGGRTAPDAAAPHVAA
jgi:DNA invertase Pin-like site-specific DNA recombinase